VSLTSPRLKLNLILECARGILQELGAAVQSSDSDVSDPTSHVTADECVTVFVYVLIRTSELAPATFEGNSFFLCVVDISNFATQLNYIRRFCSKDTLFGESG
jgi:hypothetical protein